MEELVRNDKGHRVILEGSTASPARRYTVAMERTDVLELLLKRGMDGEVEFLIEALSELVDGIMEAGGSAQAGAG